MSTIRLTLAALFVVASASVARAQQPAPGALPGNPPPLTNEIPPEPVTIGIVPASKPASERNVRVDVTLTLKGGAKAAVVKTLSMVARDGGSSSARANVEVPYVTGSLNPSGTPQYNYRNVGVNADATPTILPSGKVAVRLRLSFNTLYKAEGAENSRPSFGNSSHDAAAVVFETGKPALVIQNTDPETGRDYTVDVKATVLP
jgi:hypothetical protein